MRIQSGILCRYIVSLLSIYSAQSYAISSATSEPVAINFNGNVSTKTCSLTGESANQIFTLSDISAKGLENMAPGEYVPHTARSTLDFISCGAGSAATVKVRFIGTADSVMGQTRFAQTSGDGSGISYKIRFLRLNSQGNPAFGGDTDAAPNTWYDIIQDAATNIEYRVPFTIDRIRNDEPVLSGEVQLITEIQFGYS